MQDTTEATVWQGEFAEGSNEKRRKVDPFRQGRNSQTSFVACARDDTRRRYLSAVLDMSGPVMRQDFVLVYVEGFFFVATHEVDIELGDADLAEAVQFLAMLVDGADD